MLAREGLERSGHVVLRHELHPPRGDVRHGTVELGPLLVGEPSHPGRGVQGGEDRVDPSGLRQHGQEASTRRRADSSLEALAFSARIGSPRGSMTRFLLVCLGGALGTGARYGIALWARQALGTAFPYGTLAVNVVGSFLLSVIMYAGTNTTLLSPTMRFALSSGVMGGFTTYSSFNYETIALVEEGQIRTAMLNVVVTLVGCLAAGALGLFTAKRIFAP